MDCKAQLATPEMSTGVFSVTADHKQFMIMPKVEFSKHSINILHVKFIFNKIAFEL